MKKLLAILLSSAMLMTGLVGCAAPAAAAPAEAAPAAEAAAPAAEAPAGEAKEWKIAVVPKMTSIAWFERMEKGVEMYNEHYNANIFYGGSVEGADQAAYVESLLAEDYDAICVTPFDTEAMEPILEKARNQGIVVVTHEASFMENIDYDVEAFDNVYLGGVMMDTIAEACGKSGKYIQLVGALTSKTHMEWTEGAEARQKEAYPDMELIGKYETADDQETAYQVAKEALTANPDIVAIQGSASTDIPGVARAVEELGLTGKVTIVGFSLWSVSGKYVEDGVINAYYFWDSAYAGMAQVEIAKAVLEGRIDDIVANGIKDEFIQGYQDMTLKDNTFYASSYVYIDKNNVGDEAYHY